MKLLGQIGFIARVEAQYFTRFPKLVVATLMVALIPALYALIYLSSVWDPESNASALPVGLVNLDAGVEYREHVFNMGWEVASTLRSKHTFGFKDIAEASEARRQVRDGTLAFALIIPKDFSSNAVPGRETGGGKIIVVTSDGNNYESSRIAKLFAQELGHDVNEKLNERRWQLVLSSAAGSQRSVERLREGVQQLQSGARELKAGAAQTAAGARAAAAGSGQLGDGVVQLTHGMKQLGSGLKTLEASRARGSDLNSLKAGAEQLAAGHAELGTGLHELTTGSTRLRDGVSSFRQEAKASLLVPAAVGEGLDQVHSGVVQLEAGLETATVAQQKLSAGAQSLATGVDALTGGVRAMNTGVRSMVTKLPADSQLAELETGAVALVSATSAVANGTQQIKTGTEQLSAGLQLLESALPAQVDNPDGSPQGLAVSVAPQVEVHAVVANSGSGFAPNVIPAALWLGAGIAAFLVHVRVLPRHAQFFSRPAQTLGKFVIPCGIVLTQAALVLATVLWVLHIHVVHLGAFMLTLAVASLTFLAIVFALTRAFGDAGKALAMIFLAVQLSSSGGVLPVELSGSLFASISPWLPLTWVVRALKATMFDAYGGAWQQPLAIVALGGTVVMACACWIGRWRFVKTASMRPAVDF